MNIVSLVLAILSLLTKLLEWRKEAHWINEGQRLLIAKQLQEHNIALAKALKVEAEMAQLTDEEVRKRMEQHGWFRD